MRSGDSLIAKFARARMAPGEMEKISIPEKLLVTAGDTITVTVRDAGTVGGAR